MKTKKIILSSSELKEDLEQSELFISRSAANQSVIEEMSKDSNLSNTKTFKVAKMFTLFHGELQEMDKHYSEATDLIRHSLKKATGDRKSQYEKLLEVITYKYMDRLVIESPEKLTEKTKQMLEAINRKLMRAGIDKSKFIINWHGESLKEVVEASLVDEITKFFW